MATSVFTHLLVYYYIYDLLFSQETKNVKGDIVRILQHQIKLQLVMQICLGSGVQRKYYCGYTARFTWDLQDATKKRVLKNNSFSPLGEKPLPQKTSLSLHLSLREVSHIGLLRGIVCLFNMSLCVASHDTYALRSCTFYLFSVSVLWHTI